MLVTCATHPANEGRSRTSGQYHILVINKRKQNKKKQNKTNIKKSEDITFFYRINQGQPLYRQPKKFDLR
jgi:hypothetical protein